MPKTRRWLADGGVSFTQGLAANAPGIRDWAALRAPGWQYVENYDQPGGGTFREYYDLDRDPGMERNLLADDDPGNDPPATLAAELAAARSCTGTGCP